VGLGKAELGIYGDCPGETGKGAEISAELRTRPTDWMVTRVVGRMMRVDRIAVASCGVDGLGWLRLGWRVWLT
jgi:hypothetical protein